MWRAAGQAVLAVVSLLAYAACGEAVAQKIEVVPTAALRCLTVVPGGRVVPDYPFDALAMKEEARLRVRLSFDAADKPPKLSWLGVEEPAGHVGEFKEAVMAHARDLRVPCLGAGEGPSLIEREYVFAPDRRASHFGETVDPDEARRSALLRCFRPQRPEYPRAAVREEIHGRVLVHLNFVAPDQPPEVEVHARPYASVLARHMRSWAARQRLPCHEGGPVAFSFIYEFRFQGDPLYGLKPMLLTDLLRAAKGIREQSLQWDTNTMACPFDLRMQYRQPYRRNVVAQVGEFDPARQPLMEWLRGIELDLPSSALDAAFGSETTVTVPCLTIDLKPKE